MPRIVAFECRCVDPELRPPLAVGRNRIGHVDKDVLLRVSLQPHSTDQIGQLADAPQSILDRVDQLVFADEWIPHLNDELARILRSTPSVILSDGRLSRLLFICFPKELKPSTVKTERR